jgi:transposase-like protein
MGEYKHLTAEERLRMCQGIQRGRSLAGIARELGRSTSTISRELKRNGTGMGYLPDLAQRRYRQRRQACKPRLKLGQRDLRRQVILNLGRGWSPEQPALVGWARDCWLAASTQRTIPGLPRDHLPLCLPFAGWSAGEAVGVSAASQEAAHSAAWETIPTKPYSQPRIH